MHVRGVSQVLLQRLFEFLLKKTLRYPVLIIVGFIAKLYMRMHTTFLKCPSVICMSFCMCAHHL
jgi:hypothetical protein